jgi:hypothetical protein
VSPLVQRVFCWYSELLCIFAEQVQISQNIDVIDLLIKGPVHGENCVHMCIVKKYISLCYFGPHFLCIFVCCIFFEIATIFEVFYSKQL